jgi:phosphatidylserine/phosphatidylglycerophosphate/cardiolipin synthase-like enzyme
VLVDRWRSQGVEIKKLRATIADLPNDIQERIEGVVAQDDIKPLSDRQHYDYMLQQIQEAESSILILSGWMSSSVVDKAFIKTLEKALRRGVSVYLGYGYEDSFGNHNASHYSEAALNALKELKSKKGLAPLIVGRFNNHQKLLIRDKKRVVCGSHNWLSNRRFVNHEKSFIVDNERLAIQLFREVSEPIYKNSIL